MGSTDDLVLDTTLSNAQVFNILDGAALVAFLQYGTIPSVVISGGNAILFEIVGPGKLMMREELVDRLPGGLWLDRISGIPRVGRAVAEVII